MATHPDSAIAYVGLGSNLGDRMAHLRTAVNGIAEFGDIVAISSVYETAPVGVGDEVQPLYMNMVLAMRTTLDPRQLLEALLQIETAAGRVRVRRNSPRTLDLDILSYARVAVTEPDLEIPHPRMHERGFVMFPLLEIAPDWVHPALGLSARRIADSLPPQGIRRIGTLDALAVTIPVATLR